jgi:hypothetical protein
VAPHQAHVLIEEAEQRASSFEAKLSSRDEQVAALQDSIR